MAIKVSFKGLPSGLTFPAVDIIIIARIKQKASTHL
jgi:hypothetical protein